LGSYDSITPKLIDEIRLRGFSASTEYNFHVVFTLTHQLNPLIEHNQKLLYNLLFASASATLLEFGRNNLGATLGITAILHTLSQNLLGHYPLHCVVSGGGVSLNGQRWIGRSPKWLWPVRALAEVFRAKFRDGLKELFAQGQLQFPRGEAHLADPVLFARWLRRACRQKWVVYAKRPFAGPGAVLGYLCRYTHRVAISNRRLEHLDLEKGLVTFAYKDYAQGGPKRSMPLPLGQFLKRFCLHILPAKFVKIRHYGLLANRGRAERIGQARVLVAKAPESRRTPSPVEIVPSIKPVEAPRLVCPYCGHPALILVRVIPRPRRPCLEDSS
jgi:hypothetical protein